ncbi:MAG: pyridoxamine kinase [Parasporobacterium sp.]|nr:pyridoxamine kinase [Parasporobacterium sp.]
MNYKRILTVQDISCLGQCSGSVALPIISACGHECCLIPSAVLSTHTGGFTGYTFCDLTEEIPKIHAHWKESGIRFDCIYTGYLGSTKQIKYVADMFDDMLGLGGIKIVDPAMADNGSLYKGFDQEYVAAMGLLCAEADIVLPNVTEACFITGMEYREEYDQDYIMKLVEKLDEKGCRCIVMTGVSYREGYTGVLIYEDGFYSYYEHEKIETGCHGTGDVYASAFTGALLQNRGAVEAACIAADYVVECIRVTREDDRKKAERAEKAAKYKGPSFATDIPVCGNPGHWYGVEFERKLDVLADRINNRR